MDWTALIRDNLAVILAAISISAGVGMVAIVFLATLFKDYRSRKLELQHKQLEWKKQYHGQQLAAPIIRFIDEDLQLMASWYWSAIDKSSEKKEEKTEDREADNLILDKLVAHRENQGMIQARIASFQDEELSTAVEGFYRCQEPFRQYMADGKLVQAFDELKKAWEIAGTIYNRIGFKIPK